MKKIKLNEITLKETGEVLYQIEALEDLKFEFPFSDYVVEVPKGEKGGFIEYKDSIEGDHVWVTLDSVVSGHCKIENTYIEGGSIIEGHCYVSNSFIYSTELHNICDIKDSLLTNLIVDDEGEVTIFDSFISFGEITGKNNYIKGVNLSNLFLHKNADIYDANQYMYISNLPLVQKEDRIIVSSNYSLVINDEHIYVHVTDKKEVYKWFNFLRDYLKQFKHTFIIKLIFSYFLVAMGKTL